MDAATSEEAVEKYSKSKAIFAEASMNLREFNSNDRTFNEHFSAIEKGELNRFVKVLGILWNTQADELSIKLPQKTASSTRSKRSVLHTIASLFDPLGYLAPVAVQAKSYLQSLSPPFYHDPFMKPLESVCVVFSLVTCTETEVLASVSQASFADGQKPVRRCFMDVWQKQRRETNLRPRLRLWHGLELRIRVKVILQEQVLVLCHRCFPRHCFSSKAFQRLAELPLSRMVARPANTSAAEMCVYVSFPKLFTANANPRRP
jgi:hypothetical protein